MNEHNGLRVSKFVKYVCLSVALAASGSTAYANPLLHEPGVAGFVVLAEQRFDPAVQRYMAELSLRALPLRDGQLFYVYPQDTSRAHLEEMQIRFLEVLLHERRADDQREKQSAQEKPTSSEPASE